MSYEHSDTKSDYVPQINGTDICCLKLVTSSVALSPKRNTNIIS